LRRKRRRSNGNVVFEYPQIEWNRPVNAPDFPIEIDAGTESIPLEKALIISALKALCVGAEITQQTFYQATVFRGFLKRLAATVTDKRTTSDLELIAPGVTPEVIVVFENQNARLRFLFTVEVCGCKTADATPYDNEVVDSCVGLLNDPPVTSPLPLGQPA